MASPSGREAGVNERSSRAVTSSPSPGWMVSSSVEGVVVLGEVWAGIDVSSVPAFATW
jgi:hypothetical protein